MKNKRIRNDELRGKKREVKKEEERGRRKYKEIGNDEAKREKIG